MKLSTAESVHSETSDHPPLACDALGNLLPLPEGTAAWRVCRHTAGRPRVLTGPDGAAMRFPLTTTATALVELCGPDTYRIYALDELGEELDFVRTLHATRPRNANVPDVPFTAGLRIAPVEPPTTDLRFALEALTQIARINGEALRAISDSQADWIKTLAIAKGLPRNVAYPLLPPPREERDDESDERDRDESDEDDEPAAAPAPDPMMQFLSTVTPLIPGLLADWRGNRTAAATAPAATSGMAHLARVQRQLDPREREFLTVLLADEESGEAVAAELGARPVDEVVAMIRNRCPKTRTASAPPRFDAEQLTKRLRERVPVLLPRLSSTAQARLMALAPKVNAKALDNPALLRKLDELTRLDDAAAVAWIEANLDEIEKAIAS